MPKRRSCDKCYKYRQKCTFETDGEACTTCLLSTAKCTTARPQLRQGRRPKVTSLGPQGHVQLWDPASHSSTKKVIQEASDDVVQLGARDTTALVTAVQTRTSPTYITYQRLSPSPFNYQITFSELETPFDNDSGVLDRFYKNFDFFMFGPSFAPQLRAALQYCYACSPLLMQDILLAIANTTQCSRIVTSKVSKADIAKGAISLERLRTANITSTKDAFAIIALGQTLAAFDLLTHCIASTFILRYSLLSVRAWYGAISNNPGLDSVSITSILWDTVSCLVKRDTPIIRYVPRKTQLVDRMAGFCTTLLPILYDLCVESRKLKSERRRGCMVDNTCVSHLQQQLFFWTPDSPADLASTFSSEEILRMEAQASLYRTAGLLMCHRIHNSIGTLDCLAVSYAKEIVLDFQRYSALLSPGTRLQNVAFPVLMAALEVPEVPKEIWTMIDLSAASPACVEKLLALIEHVWTGRDAGSTSYLLDLVEEGPDFVVIP